MNNLLSQNNSQKKNKILLLFKDDSSLLSAVKFEKIMGQDLFEYEYCFAYNKKKKGKELSERQIEASLGVRKIDYKLEIREAAKESFLEQFDTIVSCKFPLIFEIKWLLNFWKFKAHRPCFVAMFPGIEFTPKLGTKTRQFADIICLNCPDDIEHYKRYVPKYLQRQNIALQFSPFFYQHKKMDIENKKIRKVVFFAQSIMPQSRESRLDVFDTLVEAAKANPNTKFSIKLRHLEVENTAHTHIEKYSYQQLAQEEYNGNLPKNLNFTAENIGTLLENSDLSVTVASTAGIEALGLGVPTLFLNNYKGSASDLHNGSMKKFAQKSDLLVSKKELLELSRLMPNAVWEKETMSTAHMVNELVVKIFDFSNTKPISRKPIIGRLKLSLIMPIIYWFL